jgi:hypothetical protein
MKKILLLLILSISIFTATAQFSKNGIDNQQVKSSQLASNASSTNGSIENITVYPNPVVDELKISFKSSGRSVAVVSLFNNIGKQVYRQESGVEPGHNIISIDIRSKSIEPGVYFIQLFDENQTITRKLIVK